MNLTYSSTKVKELLNANSCVKVKRKAPLSGQRKLLVVKDKKENNTV